MSPEEFLKEVSSQEKSLKHTDLAHLSGLSKEEMPVFEATWASFDVGSRRETLDKLLTLAETSVEMDFTPIFRFCLKNGDPIVRERAVLGLWECDERSLVAPLITLLKGDPSENVRAVSAIALGKFAALAEEGKLLPKDGPAIMDALLEVVETEEETVEVRSRAVESIAPFNTERIREILEKSYASGDPKMRYSTVYAMGKSCDPRWLATIIKETENPDPGMRYEAVNACAELAAEEAVPHLIPLIQEDDHQIQLAAVNAVGTIGGPLARKVLLRCLKMDDEAIKEAAREAIANLDLEDDSLILR